MTPSENVGPFALSSWFMTSVYNLDLLAPKPKFYFEVFLCVSVTGSSRTRATRDSWLLQAAQHRQDLNLDT